MESTRIPEETVRRISRPIEEFVSVKAHQANLYRKTCVEAKVSPREFREKGLVPRPDSIETFFGA